MSVFMLTHATDISAFLKFHLTDCLLVYLGKILCIVMTKTSVALLIFNSFTVTSISLKASIESGRAQCLVIS